MADPIPANVIGQLRQALTEMKKDAAWEFIVEPRDAVFARFQPIFQLANHPKMTEEEFKSFLDDKNNHHWSGLHRQSGRLCSDMPKLRQALGILVDESRPIEKRLDELDGYIKGLAKGTLTAILTVVYPEKYGVWNNVSAAAMAKVGVWPDFERGESFGHRYARVNAILLALANALGIDLWTLDGLWWYYSRGSELPPGIKCKADEAPPRPVGNDGQQFGPERHLHEFLVDNWDHTELGKDWNIYGEPGDDKAGVEYPCDGWRIDILAKHRREKKWLVIELKRDNVSDATVGQKLRYMGWVRHHLANIGEEVHGLVIALEPDTALQYAVSAAPNVRFLTYEVQFTLKSPPGIDEGDGNGKNRDNQLSGSANHSPR